MGRFIPDLLRAVADGWEQAAGRDPVDEHAAEAVELLDDPAVVVTTDVDEDLVIQLGLDLQESRREIERLGVVVDAARTYAELYAGARAKFCVEPSSRALVDAVRALDGKPPLSTRAATGEAG